MGPGFFFSTKTTCIIEIASNYFKLLVENSKYV